MIPVVVGAVYAAWSCFWMGMMVGDKVPTPRAVVLAVVWPFAILFWAGTLAADKIVTPYHEITDSEHAWAKGVRFKCLFGTKNTRLYFARAPKPVGDIDGGPDA